MRSLPFFFLRNYCCPVACAAIAESLPVGLLLSVWAASECEWTHHDERISVYDNDIGSHGTGDCLSFCRPNPIPGTISTVHYIRTVHLNCVPTVRPNAITAG